MQSVTRLTAPIVLNLATLKAAAKLEHLFKETGLRVEFDYHPSQA
jgi:hypothetical protein